MTEFGEKLHQESHPIDQELEGILSFVRGLEALSLDDLRVQEAIKNGTAPQDVVQYGNNFYLLFVSLLKGQQSERDFVWRVYGNPFMAEPRSREALATEAVQKVLEYLNTPTWKDYETYKNMFGDAMNSRIVDGDALRTLITTVDSVQGPYSMFRVEAAAWDPLNELLAIAGATLKEYEIDESNYFG